MKFKASFFIIVCLIFSFHFMPPAFSQEGQEDYQKLIEEFKKVLDPVTRQELENRLKILIPQQHYLIKQLESVQVNSETKAEEKKAAPEEKLQEVQQLPTEPKQPEAERIVPAEKVPVMPLAKPSAPPTVSFFFDDADIFEVAQTIFADVLKVNYIIDPQVKGRVNFRTITPIPKDEVLSVMEIIFRLNGIGFVEESGLYRIVPLPEVSRELIYSQIGKAPEKVAIEMFAFKNLELKESMPDIENALGLHLKGGTVRIVPIYRLNALIVVASAKEHLDYIRKWIEVFDSMFAVAKPKIFVYPLQNSKAAHIASLLQSIFTGTAAPSAPTTTTAPAAPKTGIQPGAAPAPRPGPAATATGGGSFVSAETRVFADEITNSLIILATPPDYSFIEETIKRLDIMPRQVVIEGLIARVDLTDNLSFGISWSLKSNVGLHPFQNKINLDGDIGINSGGLDTTKLPAKGFTFVGRDSKNTVRAVITALAEESKAKVLAAPHVLVSDNREARIQVGRQVPIATSTTSTPISGGTTVTTTSTSTIQYKDIGIILKVKPQVNDSGLISLEITQEISSLGETVKVGGLDEISINKTEAVTNLVAQDGETIIIGGLIQEDVSKSKDGIPFLSKIPVIGNLFGSTTDKTTRTELIILLTPHVIRTLQDAGDATTDYLDRYKGSTQDKNISDFIKERGQKEKSSNADKNDTR